MVGLDVALLDAITHAARFGPPAIIEAYRQAGVDFATFEAQSNALLTRAEREHKAWLEKGLELRQRIRALVDEDPRGELLEPIIDHFEDLQRKAARDTRAMKKGLARVRKRAFGVSPRDGKHVAHIEERYNAIFEESAREIGDFGLFLRALRAMHSDDGQPTGLRFDSGAEWDEYSARVLNS